MSELRTLIIQVTTSGEFTHSWWLVIAYRQFPSTCHWTSSSECSFVWWSNWRILVSISPISTTLPILQTLFHDVILLKVVEANSGAIITCPRVDPTTHSTCKSLITSLCNTNLRLCRSNSKILIIELIFVSWCRCTRRWRSIFILLMFERWPLSLLFSFLHFSLSYLSYSKTSLYISTIRP